MVPDTEREQVRAESPLNPPVAAVGVESEKLKLARLYFLSPVRQEAGRVVGEGISFHSTPEGLFHWQDWFLLNLFNSGVYQN